MSNTTLIQEVGAYPGELSEAHQQRFQQDGYVAFENVLGPTEVEEARVALTELTVTLLERATRGEAAVRQNPNATRNYAGVQIADPELGYHIDFEVGFDPLAMPPAEAELKVRKLHSFEQAHPVFTRLATAHERIIGPMSRIVGEQVMLKASMALSKPPFIAPRSRGIRTTHISTFCRWTRWQLRGSRSTMPRSTTAACM